MCKVVSTTWLVTDISDHGGTVLFRGEGENDGTCMLSEDSLGNVADPIDPENSDLLRSIFGEAQWNLCCYNPGYVPNSNDPETSKNVYVLKSQESNHT